MKLLNMGHETGPALIALETVTNALRELGKIFPVAGKSAASQALSGPLMIFSDSNSVQQTYVNSCLVINSLYLDLLLEMQSPQLTIYVFLDMKLISVIAVSVFIVRLSEVTVRCRANDSRP